MRRFTDEMDRAFQGFGTWGGGRTASMWGWSPPVEAFEREGKFVVRAELPGLGKDDVKVELTDQGLVIEGERRGEHEESREGFYRSERSYGRFHRFVPLPEGVSDTEQAQARFDNGVLEVSIPVDPSRSRRRRIPVTTEGASQQGGGEGQQGETRGRK
jgi:HSP20 family protein